MQVHRKLASGGGGGGGAVAGEVYETELVDGGAGFADGEAARAFFARLDEQLNKVNRFYERKEAEFVERGESLRRQLQILAELRPPSSPSSSATGAAADAATAATPRRRTRRIPPSPAPSSTVRAYILSSLHLSSANTCTYCVIKYVTLE